MSVPAVKAALVVEGGALRGVFSTGLLDGFLAARFNPFDLYIGVSSGASNLAAFLAEMPGRNERIYRDYARRREFIDPWRFLSGGHLMDLDWLWEITIREMRLDRERIFGRGKPFLVGLTDVRTGAALYRAARADDLEQLLKASSAIPPAYRGYPEVDGRPLADGGLTDAIPVAEAIRRGARRIMVIRSRPRDYRKSRGLLDALLRWWLRGQPALREALTDRVERYNATLDLIRRPPAGVAIVEICPPPNFRVSRLSRDPATLGEGYGQGRALAPEAIARWAAGEGKGLAGESLSANGGCHPWA